MAQIGDLAMDVDQTLALPCRLYPDHASFLWSHGQVTEIALVEVAGAGEAIRQLQKRFRARIKTNWTMAPPKRCSSV